jgi:basic amino acid/polyamine antiporter, APA family
MAPDSTSARTGDQEAKQRSNRLPRKLGLWSTFGLVIGITIGSGIFRTPAGIAGLVPQPPLILALWIAGGLVSLCGALSFAELAATFPESGGFYAYLREGWGRPVAFLFGWSELVLIRASALGGMAIVFGEYALRTFGVDPTKHVLAARSIAAAAIAFSAAANIRGAVVGARVVGLSTAAKVAALAGLALAAFLLGGAHGASLGHFAASAGAARPTAGSIGLAFVSVLYAYDGFGDVSFAGGEVMNPSRNLPRAIVLGTGAIVVLYLAVNAAYLYVMPVDQVARSPLVAADVMQAVFGRAGGVAVSFVVMISSFSAVNGVTLSAPRIFFAMAEDRLFFSALARVHPRFHTPYVAIGLSALLGMALVMSRSFEALSSTMVIAIWPFYALTVASIFRLRRLRPELPRPYRVAGYPFVPAIFVATVVWFVVNALIAAPISTATTLALILVGVPVYFFSFARDEFR